jgi:DNA-binding SARP family transcriptional activator
MKVTRNEFNLDAHTGWTAELAAVTLPEFNGDSAAMTRLLEEMQSGLDSRLLMLNRKLDRLLGILADQTPTIGDPGGDEVQPAVVVTCLGSFRLKIDGIEVTQWRSGKARALFQYLVNRRRRLVSSDVLIEALWPDPDAVAARTSLKVAVHALRQVFSGMEGENSLSILAHEKGYQLNGKQLWLDVEEFERSYVLGRGLETEGHLAEALSWYTRAADLYRGDFLEDVWDEWVVFRRELLKDRYLFVLACLARAAADAGRFQDCIVRCQQLLEKDRCREDAYRMLMLCHSRLGQRSRVKSWYEFCVRALRAELDTTPEPTTIDMYHLALAGRA